jgi:protoporphyrinogen oxidase
MRDVVIVGGGLTGLAAAYELEKQQIPYTLIEVKRRLGGSIQTLTQNNLVLDGAAFALTPELQAHPLIAALGLQDAFFALKEDAVAFKHGTETLIQALAAKLTAPRMMRMAVSSVGELENGHFGICLENGLLLDAKALILALPARYAERLFYGYITPITELLLPYKYDTLVRASVVISLDDWRDSIQLPEVVFTHTTFDASRIPAGNMLKQFGIRYEGDASNVEQMLKLVASVLHYYSLKSKFTHFWAEADSLSCYDTDHAQRSAAIQDLLPPGIALIGSDYTVSPARLGLANLADRLDQAMQAAQQIQAFLQNRKNDHDR